MIDSQLLGTISARNQVNINAVLWLKHQIIAKQR